MDDEKRQKRLDNLAKARAKILELRQQKEKLSVKSKDEPEKKVDTVVEDDKVVEKETIDTPDTPDTTPVVKEVVKEVVQPPVKEIIEQPKKVRKAYVKKEKPIVVKEEPIVIENKPVKLTFTRGVNGLFYI